MSDSFSYIHHNLTDCVVLTSLSLSLNLYSCPSNEVEVEVEEEEEEEEMYLNPAEINFEECSSGAINDCIKAEESLIPNCVNAIVEFEFKSCGVSGVTDVSTVEQTYRAVEPEKHQ